MSSTQSVTRWAPRSSSRSTSAVEGDAVGLLVGGIGSGVVAGADAVEQVLVIAEEALEALFDDAAQGGDGEVGFAGAGLADEQAGRGGRRRESRGRNSRTVTMMLESWRAGQGIVGAGGRSYRTTRCGRAGGIWERSSMRAARPWKRQSQGSAPETAERSTMIQPVPPHFGQTGSVAIAPIISQTGWKEAGFRSGERRREGRPGGLPHIGSVADGNHDRTGRRGTDTGG